MKVPRDVDDACHGKTWGPGLLGPQSLALGLRPPWEPHTPGPPMGRSWGLSGLQGQLPSSGCRLGAWGVVRST